MEFKNEAEAFNYYKSYDVAAIEKRAAEIDKLIESNPAIDMKGVNIELAGLKAAKQNIEERAAAKKTGAAILTGMSFSHGASLPKDETIYGTKEYRSAFFKKLLGRDGSMTHEETTAYETAMNLERRADTFASTSNTGAVIPTQTLNEIVSKARTMGGLISVSRGFNIPANVAVPVATPATKAEWHTEGAAASTDKPSIVNVAFGAYELLKVFSISAAVNKMSIPAFEAYLTSELAACVMDTIADSLVNGTGSGQGTGVLTGVTWDSTNSTTFAKTGSPAYKDFAKIASMLKRGYGANATWAMSNATLYNLVYGLVDSNGRPIFVNDPKMEEVGFILGKPVVVDDYIADDTLLFGDFNYLAYNLAENILLEVSRDSSFKSGLVDYRALAIADTKPLVSEAFVKMARATA